MSDRTLYLPGGTFVVGEDWINVTDELDPGSPTTLVRLPDEPGVLQFSIASYESGAHPNIQAVDLRKMLTNIMRSNAGVTPAAVREIPDVLTIVGGECPHDGQRIRIWYVTDSRNVAMISYFGEIVSWESEVPICEKIVRSFRFTPYRPPAA